MTPTTPSAAEARRLRLPDALTQHIGLIGVIVVIGVFLTVATDAFATGPNLVNVLRQISVMAVLAAGLTLLLGAGGLDFSLGSQVAVVVATLAQLLSAGVPLPIALAAVLALGVVMGLLNGVIITVFGVAPFVVTLASATLLDGVALIIQNGQSVSIGGDLTALGLGTAFGIPYLVLIAAAICAIAAIVLRWTRFGRDILAIGGNKAAARLTGIPVRSRTVTLYALNGLFAGIAGIMLLSRLGASSPGTAGLPLELSVVAAVVIGGTALHGGSATVFGTVLGVLLLGIVANGLNLLQIDSFYQPVSVGLVLLVAAVINELRYRRKR
ncbi:ABC transporter permease [Herbiconiux ginsengi]|uniref:Ribose ABC transporter membrane protein n=1 Tax=Herbiconiux ginsengi TaxID=381665 RepID=A0A1H3MS59_9MICO|nr:ABC transporter permease [Herbiconiux ginsengi]SDY78899.1 ribose ABC transporter membrane protein [Herbiconiux ginsengi]